MRPSGDGRVNKYMRTLVLSHLNSTAILDTVHAATPNVADLKDGDQTA
jgi:hypothetical protein